MFDERPSREELVDLCPDCGEQLDYGREECVTLSCPRYLEVTNSLEAESVLSPIRDTREIRGEDEAFLEEDVA